MDKKEIDQPLLFSDTSRDVLDTSSLDPLPPYDDHFTTSSHPSNHNRHTRNVPVLTLVVLLSFIAVSLFIATHSRGELITSTNRSGFSDTSSNEGGTQTADHHPQSDPKSARRRRLPSALIIGAKKSGTRALLEFMRSHPNVKAMAQESHFFDKHYDKGLDWYRFDMLLFISFYYLHIVFIT